MLWCPQLPGAPGIMPSAGLLALVDGHQRRERSRPLEFAGNWSVAGDCWAHDKGTSWVVEERARDVIDEKLPCLLIERHSLGRIDRGVAFSSKCVELFVTVRDSVER